VANRGARVADRDASYWVLDPRSPDAAVDRLRALRQGLKGMGYVEGENVAIV